MIRNFRRCRRSISAACTRLQNTGNVGGLPHDFAPDGVGRTFMKRGAGPVGLTVSIKLPSHASFCRGKSDHPNLAANVPGF